MRRPTIGGRIRCILTDGGAKALVRIRSLAARHEARMIELIGRERRLLLLDLLREFG